MSQEISSADVPNPLPEDGERFQKLLELLESYGTTMVAYSGGLDSTLLAYAAHQALGDKALAVTAISPSLASTDRARAARIAQRFGFSHRELFTEELQQEEYRRNHADRCFFCKRELFQRMRKLASNGGYSTLVYGAIPEDRGDHRPGAQAAEQAEVKSPLAEVGLGKESLRRLSRSFGLETWNLPAQACLASRIAYRTPVTAEKLQAVEQAEALLKSLGFSACRVRHHEGIARIEVPKARFLQILEHHEEISQTLRELGFLYVTLDLMGLRSGSMNDMLKLRVLS